MKNERDRLVEHVNETHEVLNEVERALDDSGRLDSVAGLLAELDETAISITVLTDHLSRLSDRLAEVRKKMRALVTLDRMEPRKRSSVPPPAVDE